MDKNMRQAKAAKARSEEAALNRIMCWLAGGVVLEFLLLFLDRYYNHYTVSEVELRVALGTTVKILAAAALICAAAAGFWWNTARKGGRSVNLPATLCLFLAGLSLSCFAAWFFPSMGLRVMYLIVPGVIVLALVYYLYQREFFVVACQSALALLGIWLCSLGLSGANSLACYAYAAGAVVLVLLAALLCRKAQGEKGLVTWKGRQVRLFAKDANYALLYGGGIVTVGVLVAALIGAPSVILYAVEVAWTLIMAVYYTVKLM